ncbi:cell division protein FtsL [Carnobacterium iners]|uniref:Cell division protein FtsL n=1 Tax=Carnobacterium iners TaxID=1073423 RepID=A0A1X7NNF5_9LACT|nr:cell division protein FtsL [Carnobacterium iners]SEK30377.1 cell division protein FtsL [Carnobacterium iners]SMH39579.1 cell division protein FtsL [Carnobacterium iners]
MPLNSNSARKVEVEIPLQSPLNTPEQSTRMVHKSIPKKSIVTGLEKMLMGMIMAIAFTLMTISISLEINIASTNRALQDTKASILSTTTVNSNLQQEVQELSRYDRIYRIANEQGLKMNEANVRNVIK